jgi:hypothetical protein
MHGTSLAYDLHNALFIEPNTRQRINKGIHMISGIVITAMLAIYFLSEVRA